MVFLVSLFSYSLVWFKLVCAVCRARAGLAKQHDCGIECSCLSQYVGRGNSIWFGLPGFSFYEVWSDCSVLVSSVWSFLLVLVWRGSYCPGLVVLVYRIPGQAWSRLLCSALPKFGLFALVCIGLVEAALLQAGLLPLISVLSCSLWSVLVWSPLLYSRLVCSGLFGWFVLPQVGLG